MGKIRAQKNYSVINNSNNADFISMPKNDVGSMDFNVFGDITASSVVKNLLSDLENTPISHTQCTEKNLTNNKENEV